MAKRSVKVLVRAFAGAIHVAGVPLVLGRGHRVDAPVDEDAEFCVLVPLRLLVLDERGPVGAKGAVVSLALGLGKEAVALRVVLAHRLLPFFVDLGRGFDVPGWARAGQTVRRSCASRVAATIGSRARQRTKFCIGTHRKLRRRGAANAFTSAANRNLRRPLDIFPYRNVLFSTWHRAATTSDAFNAVAEPRRREILTLLVVRELPVGAIVAGSRSISLRFQSICACCATWVWCMCGAMGGTSSTARTRRRFAPCMNGRRPSSATGGTS